MQRQLLEIVGPGITPGSGPGHLALFGYDPLRWRIGRGVLSALGIDFPLAPGDLAARVNFATLDDAGNITDRRAGRIPTDLNRQLCEKIRSAVHLDFDGELFFEPESEHRAVLVLRGEGLSDDLPDTDSAGEDGDLARKADVIEAVYHQLPRLLALRPDVLFIIGDHSTPASMASHSWHPVPVLLHARHARRGSAERFDETACLAGALGLRRGVDLMGLSLGNAGRLKKFGA